MKPIDLNKENIPLSINEKVRQYKEMIQELEKSLMNITGIPKKYFEVCVGYTSVRKMS